ncbi:MAG: hypothetical protein EKK47_21800 [Burkholderiales bacterium]|jgi:hypothetical protein|nr:MAG: hypothetical protein EKK47_21800 [Burkholderiales bacterium]
MALSRLAIAAAVSATLSGCASLFPADYGRSYSPGLGCFVIGWGDQPNNTTTRTSSVLFQGVGSGKYGVVKFSHMALESLADGPLFTDSDGHGIVTARYVPPGTYQLYEPAIYWTQYPMVYTLKPRTPVSIPFQVKANECTYVGRFLMNTVKPEFLWLNRKDADLKVIATELPKDMKAFNEVLTPKPIGDFIVTE